MNISSFSSSLMKVSLLKSTKSRETDDNSLVDRSLAEMADLMNVAWTEIHIHPAHSMQNQNQNHGHGHANGQVQSPCHDSTFYPEEEFSEFDQCFSSTESDALERFLDNIINPSGCIHPMNLHNTGKPAKPVHFDTTFDLHTSKTSKSNTDYELLLKKELNEAFSYPTENLFKNEDVQPIQNYSPSSSSPNFQLPTPNDSRQNSNTDHELLLKNELNEVFSYPIENFSKDEDMNHIENYSSSSPNFQLPTPSDSHETSNSNIMYNCKQDQLNSPPEDKKIIMMDEDVFSPKFKKGSSNKYLLTLEQKRLNHSRSEQKRRQLCKLAYERSLKLIINMELFNKLPNNLWNKKSKRAKLNRDGLPNLSKHSALNRVSSEIMLIYNKNEQLKELLKHHGYRG